MATTRNYEAAYAAILPRVQKPGRYLGNEFGVVRKDPSAVRLRVALAFPDVYEIAQSHPGLHILYDLLNRREDVYAERVYAPWVDMEQALREHDLPLVSLETFTPLYEFDILGFTLQYELTYTNLLAMLSLGKIPLLASERDSTCPLVIAGGPCAFNPEPLAPFLDAVLLGDGEEAIHDICNVVVECKLAGANREQLLLALRHVPGIYVPAFFTPQYSAEGRFAGIVPTFADYTRVTKRVVRDLDSVPSRTTFVVPIVQVVHDRPSIEVMRGCVKGCRFCQAGYIYRPLRERHPQKVIDEAVRAATSTGQEELSLLSLSTGDYSCINPVLKELMDRLENSRVALSLPSTRVEALAANLLEQIRRVRKTGFTLAPEAGTQRLRDIIQKEYSEQELIDAASLIFSLGWRHLKLYFMLGLPGETEEDLLGIVELCARIRSVAPRGAAVIASVSNFVPKPHTPFQWVQQLSAEEVVARQNLLLREFSKKGLGFRYHDTRLSVLEGVFSRGGRHLSHTLQRAFELGCRFDGWSDQCRFDLWEQAFRETNIDVKQELRRRHLDEPLPWDHLHAGVTKQFLQRELARAFEGKLTPDCSVSRCTYCGACDFKTVRNIDYHLHGSKAAEHRGIRVAHWAAEVIAATDGQDLASWEPRGWKKVHRPEQIQNTPKEILACAPTASTRERAVGKLPPATPPRILGTAEEWIEANGEGALQSSPPAPGGEACCRIRLTYVKKDRARFIGSVELTNIFYRALRRAELPIAFTQGHHPLPRVSFGPALPFGIESHCELADIYFTQVVDPTIVQTKLNQQLPPGLRVQYSELVELRGPSLGQAIAGFVYAVKLAPVLADRGIAFVEERLRNFRASEVFPIPKASGNGSGTVDARKIVSALDLTTDGVLTFAARMTPAGTIKLRQFLQALLCLTEDQVLVLEVCKVHTTLANPAPASNEPQFEPLGSAERT